MVMLMRQTISTTKESNYLMSTFSLPKKSIIVFTDLDGSLLNHDDYSYTAAKPALSKVVELDIPLIPVSSKTCAEIQYIFKSLDIEHPIIAENGSLIVIPPYYFNSEMTSSSTIYIGKSYAEITEILEKLRKQFAFIGFNNMSEAKVASITGLSRPEAIRAKQRQASEPIIWEDSQEQFMKFKEKLQEYQLTLTRGGRFWHVMGGNSKGAAILELLALYKTHGFSPENTLGIGDSDNDISMLKSVSLPVVIKKIDGSHLEAELPEATVYTNEKGPLGWNTAVLNVFNQ